MSEVHLWNWRRALHCAWAFVASRERHCPVSDAKVSTARQVSESVHRLLGAPAHPRKDDPLLPRPIPIPGQARLGRRGG